MFLLFWAFYPINFFPWVTFRQRNKNQKRHSPLTSGEYCDFFRKLFRAKVKVKVFLDLVSSTDGMTDLKTELVSKQVNWLLLATFVVVCIVSLFTISDFSRLIFFLLLRARQANGSIRRFFMILLYMKCIQKKDNKWIDEMIFIWNWFGSMNRDGNFWRSFGVWLIIDSICHFEILHTELLGTIFV